MPAPSARIPHPPRVVKAARLFAYVLGAAILLALLPLPWGMAGLPFAVAAVVLGVRAVILMRSVTSTGWWTLVVGGLLVASSLALNYGVAVVLYDELRTLQDCNAGAITIAARDRCSAEFEEAARVRLSRLGLPLSWLLGTDS